MLGHVLLLLAGVAITHVAFSTYEYLSLLKALGRPEGSLPTDIVLEALVGLVFGIFGASLYFNQVMPLKEITWAREMKKRSIDEMDSRLGFASFVNRGRFLNSLSEGQSREIVPPS